MQVPVRARGAGLRGGTYQDPSRTSFPGHTHKLHSTMSMYVLVPYSVVLYFSHRIAAQPQLSSVPVLSIHTSTIVDVCKRYLHTMYSKKMLPTYRYTMYVYICYIHDVRWKLQTWTCTATCSFTMAITVHTHGTKYIVLMYE